MIKLVLVLLVLMIAIPLLRRASGKTDPESKPKKDDEDDAEAPKKSDFSALMRTVVWLEDNDWSACTFDGVKEDWARFTSEPVRGFCTISAGRHRAATKVGGREALLDFVLRPGEVFARRLDRENARWVELDSAALAGVRRDAAGGETGALGEALVRYRSTMGVARAMTGKIASPERAYEDAKNELSSIVEAACQAEPPADLEARAAAAGEMLVGVPLLLEQLDALVAIVADAIASHPACAPRVRSLGLTVLPGAFRPE